MIWAGREAPGGDRTGFLVEWDDHFGDPPRPATKAPPAEPFTNSLGTNLFPVPGTQILLSIHETRKGDYAAYARETEGVDGSWSNPNYQGVPVSTDDTHPVVMVNWFEARAFCDWETLAEWCEDGFNEERRQRVLRGGSWFDQGPPYSSWRLRDFPGSCRFYFGFRCAVEVAAPGNGTSH